MGIFNSLIDGAESLSQNINKIVGNENAQETEQGVVSEYLPELSLDMDDKELYNLTKKWKDQWDKSEVKKDWIRKADECEKYWLGNQFNLAKGYLETNRPIMDNVIFESVEIYLPQITRRNPEPMVSLKHERQEPAPDELSFAKDIEKTLGDIADEKKLRLKLKRAGRHWSIYLLGVAEVGWDNKKNIPTVEIVRPTKLILDPDSTVTEDGYTGKYIGKFQKMKASKLVEFAKDKEKEIKNLAKKDMDTELQFIEWWTDEYTCWTIGETVLLKKKNIHWNYDQDDEEEEVDEYGEVTKEKTVIEGSNHFKYSKMPFVFLSVFNLGKQPMDDTSLIYQNLANQDIINKRNRQMDKNIDGFNSGMVVSGEYSGLSKDQASQATQALLRGGTVYIPQGLPQNAVMRMTPQGLPADVFNNLIDMRNRVQDIFGTRGSSAGGNSSEDTVRGKLINRGLDTDRIGGGVSEFLEQFADDIYNWWLQLMYVYDESFDMENKPELIVSVKEGSLLPKDSTTIANQSMELAKMGRMSTLDLYRNLDYANPEELASNVWMEQNAPEQLYKNSEEVKKVMEQKSQQGTQEMQRELQIEVQKEQATEAIKHKNKLTEETHKANLDIRKEVAKGEVDIAQDVIGNKLPERQ